MDNTQIFNFLKKAINKILDVRCIFCLSKNISQDISFVCNDCLNKFLMEDMETEKCPTCSHPIKNGIKCPSCSDLGRVYYDSYLCLQYYTDFFKNTALMWKKDRNYLINKLFYHLLIEKNLLDIDKAVTTVPDTLFKSFKKGRSSLHYLLALLNKSGYKTIKNVYKKKTFIFKSQKNRKKNQRIKEIESSFYLPERNNKKFNGEIYLIDDIYTTGSTLNYGAKLLKDAGFKKVHAISFFRTVIDK